MNSNELADLMDSRSVEGSQAREASALLRTIPLLQAEIEVLKIKLAEAIDAEKDRRFE